MSDYYLIRSAFIKLKDIEEDLR